MTENPTSGENLLVEPCPIIPTELVITKGIHDHAVALAASKGMTVIDLRNLDASVAIRLMLENKAVAVAGRHHLGKAYSKADSEILRAQRARGLLMIKHSGQRYQGDPYMALDEGIIVERTPRGNAEAVRIFQDLLLMCLLDPKSPHAGSTKNPAARVNRLIKNEKFYGKLYWDRRKVTRAVNPDSLVLEDLPPEARQSTEYLSGKKVAVIGAGRIGMQVLEKSPFLKNANVFVYDPLVKNISGVTNVNSLEEAIDQAEVVLLHVSYGECIIGEKEIAMLRDKAIICNIARRRNIDPIALYKTIESGKIAGAGLDCHAVETGIEAFQSPPQSEATMEIGHYVYKMLNMPQVVASNHTAAHEEVAELINAHDAVEEIAEYTRRGVIRHGLAVPDIEFPSAQLARLKTYTVLQTVYRKNLKATEGNVKMALSTLEAEGFYIAGNTSSEKTDPQNGVTCSRFSIIERPPGILGDRLDSFHQKLIKVMETYHRARIARIFNVTAQ